MFERWGRVVYRRRRLVLVIALIAVSFAAVWGTGVFGKLQSSGGFTPPNSQSQQSSNLAAAVFGRDAGDLVVLYSSPSLSAASPAYRTAVTHALAALPSSKVASYETYWSTKLPQFVSPGGRDTYAVLALKGADDGARQKSYDAIKNQLGAPGLRTQVGGTIPTNEAINKEVTSDIGRAEGFSMPVLLIVLLLIFGSLAAASVPLAIGGIAILGSFTALRLLTLGTTVSIYSVNITTILGLGLGIDYGLFLVSRFREELHRHDSVEDAVARTVATAGRTVAVSGITVAAALASLMLFPETFLRSMGYGGVATVLVDMLAALTVLPALLAVLGHHSGRGAGRQRGRIRPAPGDPQERRAERQQHDHDRDGVHQRAAHHAARQPVPGASGDRGTEPGLPWQPDRPDRVRGPIRRPGGRLVERGAGGVREPPRPRPRGQRRTGDRRPRGHRAGGHTLWPATLLTAGPGHRRAGQGRRGAARRAGVRGRAKRAACR